MSDEDATYGLVMPFVVCQSKDGPYDDDSFAAGWACAQIDSMLAAQPAEVAQTVRTAIVPQLDLIAMRYGFVASFDPWDEGPDEWTFATFKPGSPRIGARKQNDKKEQ